MAKQKQRVQVAPPQPVQTTLQPQANPIDTYSAPLTQLPRDSNSLLELAQGLAAIEPALGSFVDAAVTKQIAEDNAAVIAGDPEKFAADREANRAGFKKAIDRGEIAPAQSPWFRKGHRQAKNRIAARELDAALRVAWEQSDVKNSDDPAAIATFMQEQTKAFVEARGLGGDPEFATVFAPMAEQAQAGAMQRHTAHRLNAIEQETKINTGREITLLMEQRLDGMMGWDQDRTAADIKAIVDEGYKNGLSGTVSNQIVAESLARVAEDRLDPSVLELLDKIDTGNGAVGSIGTIRDIRRKTEDSIYRQIQERDRMDSHAAKTMREEKSRQLKAAGFSAVYQDPGADIKKIVLELAAHDPEGAAQLEGWQRAAVANIGKRVEDEEFSLDLQARVYSGQATMDDIISAASERQIDKDTASELIKALPQAQDFRNPMNNPIIKDVLFDLDKAIRGNETDFKGPAAIKASRATAQAAQMLHEHFMQNPNMSTLEKLQKAAEVREALQRLYISDDVTTANQDNPIAALSAAPQAFDWKNTLLFMDEGELAATINQYNTSGGKSGDLVDMAARLRIAPMDLYRAQRTALAKETERKKTQGKK